MISQTPFELVNQKILLSKLETIGIRGVVLKWFERVFPILTYINEVIRVRTSLSKASVVRSEVPQESVLCATLFIILTNNSLRLLSKGNVITLADGIALFYCHEQEQGLGDCMLDTWLC